MENVMTGLVVMVIGMAVVYAFLAIMILVMNLSAKAIQILNKYKILNIMFYFII